MSEFSYVTRAVALDRFKNETFDLLIIGGGITGAATARDAVSRGLKVALIEQNDFASGTSSKSSKLIHGGLRYLENYEFKLVFEALSERTHLLKTTPHMVRPLLFYLPVYQKDKHGLGILSLGLWLYDFLSLFRTPGFHRRLSAKKFLKEIPILDPHGLNGGFSYYDASMWDDVLAVETLRSAQALGATVANYVRAGDPIWENGQVCGFWVQDQNTYQVPSKPFALKAKKIVICAGPWTDELGKKLSPQWKPWLNPSKGIHLVFDLKRIPVPGALVMNHPKDGRIAFVIPRPDLGAGVVIVGTTDGPAPTEPARAKVQQPEVEYLMNLLQRYFPSLGLKTSDILSAYVGVRPLMGDVVPRGFEQSQSSETQALQKVSREHFIGNGPGGTVLVAGGKYTTHRTMAIEIVDHVLESWRTGPQKDSFPEGLKKSDTRKPLNLAITDLAIEQARQEAEKRNWVVSESLWNRYGAEALKIIAHYYPRQAGGVLGAEKSSAFHVDFHERTGEIEVDPVGFPYLRGQLLHNMQYGMVMHLEDFYFRRTPLFMSRQDHGLPWARELALAWAHARGFSESDSTEMIEKELARLDEAVESRSMVAP